MRSLLLCVLLVAPLAACGGSDFDPAVFRTAVAKGDLETMKEQASRAEDDDDLLGRKQADLRPLFGKPSRELRDGTVWAWPLGMINDVMGPGDAGSLYVVFGRDRRLRSVRVDQTLDR